MSSSCSSCSCRPAPVETSITLSSSSSCSSSSSSSCSSSSSSSSLPLCLTRCRRPRRVLYPASRSRRPPQTEAPDPARRWLLLLSGLVLLQIYSEETHTCTELQSPGPEPGACPHQEGGGSLGVAPGRSPEEPRRLQPGGGASEAQMECVAV